MENRKKSPIRMSLIETVMKSLNEDLLAAAARESKIVAAELEGYLKMMTRDSKVANELTRAGIRTSEELLAALKGNRLTTTLKGSLELSVLKSNTKNAKLIDLASENLVRNKMFDKKYAAEIAKGQPALEKALKQAGYSDDAITKIVQKKFNLPTPKPTPPNPKPTPPPPPKVQEWWKRWKDEFLLFLKKKPKWQDVVKWGVGVGLSAAALWWMINEFAPEEKMEDYPPVPPVDDSAWAPCIKELLKSKEGILGTSKSGQVSVTVKTADFPSGVNFYSNGRVFDIAGKKMGTWKCKNNMPRIQAESKIISLKGLLNEQGGEISDETMDSYVDTAVDDLDGYVAEYNLKSLKDILTALKGKTFQGEDATKKFLQFYKEDEGVDFVTDVNSVGVANLSVMAKNMKPQIIAMAKGGGTPPPPIPKSGGKGLDNIDIKWDGAKKDDDGKKDDGTIIPKPKKQVNYHDCSSKDFPYEFGCIAPKIAEIQGCIGVKPQKGYFGPKTLSALKNLEYIKGESVITKEMYDKIKTLPGCGQPVKTDDKKVVNPAPEEKPQAQIPTGGENPDEASLKKPEVAPTPAPTAAEETGEDIYNRLKNQGIFRGREIDNNERVVYKGGKLSASDFEKLDQYFISKGYRRETPTIEDKRYGIKAVWWRQKRR
jgi:hypothetical protein